MVSIADSIRQISEMSTQIASAAEEQRSVTEEVSRNLEKVMEMSEVMVSDAQETTSVAEALGDISNNLKEQVGQFKI